ncbi:SDR family oxidoreductase [Streptomyces violaceusniger]|uniref:Short-chain dehydrogenase/reductase n=1 Tax=Streptomyces violaceusniger TaxID=68280 RepID=A0A4D4L2D9_STRVO|nr:short-chain dehydrogenase/reductase [Streptomyces violaceusniger]
MSNVLITGCSSGFGRLIALALARRGDRVFATVRRPETVAGLEGLAEGLPLSAHLLDVTDAGSIERAVAEVADKGGIDVLVNNAGYALRGPVVSLQDDEVARQFDTNVVGIVRMVRAVVPHMRERGGGTIVNLSSAAGLIGIPFEGAYAASKHAVEGLSETLRFELAADGIAVALIEPGAFDTGFFDNVTESRGFGADHPDRPVFDHYHERMMAVGGAGRAAPQPVVDAVLEAIDHPDGPFRRLVGDDAELVVRIKRERPFAELEAGMRAALGEPT